MARLLLDQIPSWMAITGEKTLQRYIFYTHYIICKIYDLFSLVHTMLLTKEHQQKYVVSFNVWSIVSMQVSMVIAKLVSTCFFVTGTATKKEIC